MKVFVTGADGMLGNHICRTLLEKGHEVMALVLNQKNAFSLKAVPVHLIEGNVLNPESFEHAFKNCEAVIHAAALLDVWPRKSDRIIQVNLEGTRNIISLVKKYNLKRMVFIGSASSFGHGTKKHPGDETTPSTLEKLGMDYINSKSNAQKLVIDESKYHRLPGIVINPTFMIGAYDSGPSSGKLILQLLKKKLPGYPPGGKNFVWAGDVAMAAVNALEKGRIGECYIAGNENLSYKDFFKRVLKTQHLEMTLLPVPKALMLAFGMIQSGISRISRQRPTLSYSMAKVGCLYQFYSAKKAVEELDMPQTPIEKGIELCIEWFKNNGYWKG